MRGHMNDVFDLSGRVAVITGGAGLLGRKHAEAIAGRGGNPVLVDLAIAEPEEKARQISSAFGVDAMGYAADITCPEQIQGLLDSILARYSRIDILINNAANNPKMEGPRRSPGRDWKTFRSQCGKPISPWGSRGPSSVAVCWAVKWPGAKGASS